MQKHIWSFGAVALAACTPLTRASYARPLPSVDPNELTSTRNNAPVQPDSLQTIVVTPSDWATMHDPAALARTQVVCDVPAAQIDAKALHAVSAMATELTKKTTPAPAHSAMLDLQSLAVTCDASHAVVMLNGTPFSTEQIYAAERTELDGTRVLLIEAMARATGSLLFVAVTFDGPVATGKPTEAGFAIANVTQFLTSDDDVLVMPAERAPTFEMYISNRAKTPESGVYLTGPTYVSDGSLHIHAARFVVAS